MQATNWEKIFLSISISYILIYIYPSHYIYDIYQYICHIYVCVFIYISIYLYIKALMFFFILDKKKTENIEKHVKDMSRCITEKIQLADKHKWMSNFPINQNTKN